MHNLGICTDDDDDDDVACLRLSHNLFIHLPSTTPEVGHMGVHNTYTISKTNISPNIHIFSPTYE